MNPEPLDMGTPNSAFAWDFIPRALGLWVLGTPDLAFVWDMDPPGNYLPYSFTGTVSEHRSKDNMVKARFTKVVFSVYVLTGAMFEMARHASSWIRHNVPILGPTNPPFSR